MEETGYFFLFDIIAYFQDPDHVSDSGQSVGDSMVRWLLHLSHSLGPGYAGLRGCLLVEWGHATGLFFLSELPRGC